VCRGPPSTAGDRPRTAPTVAGRRRTTGAGVGTRVREDGGVTEPTSRTPAPAPAPAPRGMRVGTIVWGLVLAAIGAGVLAWAIGVSFDVELAFIVLIAAAGVLLLVGSLATMVRRRR